MGNIVPKFCLKTIVFFVIVITLFSANSALAESAKASFEDWLAVFKASAEHKGISKETLDVALQDLKFVPKIVKMDRNQPETKLTLQKYLSRVISRARVVTGRKKLKALQPLLRKIQQQYGVQARFIVAFWALETDFGRLTGGHYVIQALATLAYEGRRGQFFRKELMNALRIMEAGHVVRADMTGSWAGAMGQTQFMPSTFLGYAVDYNGDGKKNIWLTLEDALASAANYLSRLEWRDDITWGREVTLLAEFDDKLIDLTIEKRLSEWQALGVRKIDGRRLPTRDLMASIVRPDGEGGRAFIVYSNYRAILKWNRSHYFAISVGLLSNQIAQQ